MMNSVRYTSELREEWNRFVATSRNGNFLFDRNFMDYHSDRFCDCSLLFYEHNRLVALLPANYDAASRTVHSHQGLTYGGLIMSHRLTTKGVMEAFRLMQQYFHESLQAERIIYKPIPYIYNRYASEEDLYALFRCGATLHSRGISSCIELQRRIPITESRKSGLRKAADLTVRETDDVEGFWTILDSVLTTSHNVHPVHSTSELRLLMSRFPDRIRLFGTFSDDGRMLAGSLVFDFGDTIHTQYLASSDEGKATGALDRLIMALITDIYPDRCYLDFGISTEQGGRVLNEGLIFQKEGFGARGICYDSYEITLIPDS